jgi:pentatricopeptide repeat protein
VPSILAEHPSAPHDAITDSILAKSLYVTSGADSTLHLIREPSSVVVPSVQLFTSIIDSFYKQRLPHRAEEMFHSMAEDHEITPTLPPTMLGSPTSPQTAPWRRCRS